MSSKKAKKRKKLERRGRPREADARSRQTTRAGRAGSQDEGTDELQQKRAEALGGDLRGADLEFPADVLVARGLLSRDMRDELLRFAQLAWWLYGFPSASCEALYDRMCAGGSGEDFAPRAEGEADDPDEQRRRLDLIRSRKRRFDKMLRTLGPHAPYVRKLAVNLTPPAFLDGARSALAFLEMSHVVRGASLLVRQRDQEDAAWKARRAAAVRELSTGLRDAPQTSAPGAPPYTGRTVANRGGGEASPSPRPIVHG